MNDKILELTNNFLTSSGWIKSWQENQCVDNDGNFLPWYSYPIIDFLKKRLNQDMSVFEFGCGYSSLFYAKYCQKVTSIETKIEWIDKINKISIEKNINNLKIELTKTDFATSINLTNQKFDLIIIDSAQRFNCAVNSVSNLTEKGLIILDNSEREKYIKIFDFLDSKHFKNLTFCGIGPLRCDVSSTTIFYLKDNIFNL